MAVLGKAFQRNSCPSLSREAQCEPNVSPMGLPTQKPEMTRVWKMRWEMSCVPFELLDSIRK